MKIQNTSSVQPGNPHGMHRYSQISCRCSSNEFVAKNRALQPGHFK
jgi:hypothetical protein